MIAETLDKNHYLGSKGARPRLVYEDAHGIIVFSSPSSRYIPNHWIELSRWCILENGHGSVQWAAAKLWLLSQMPDLTTVVSYSDPSVGHTGSLYRACGWIWAPTWHVLRPPPTGGGTRGGKKQSPKHRYVYLLAPDDTREIALQLRDDSLKKRYPWISYNEPRWRRGKPILEDRPKAYKRWANLQG